jgi:hypothetical protein
VVAAAVAWAAWAAWTCSPVAGWRLGRPDREKARGCCRGPFSLGRGLVPDGASRTGESWRARRAARSSETGSSFAVVLRSRCGRAHASGGSSAASDNDEPLRRRLARHHLGHGWQPSDRGTANRFLVRGRITPVVELGRRQPAYRLLCASHATIVSAPQQWDGSSSLTLRWLSTLTRFSTINEATFDCSGRRRSWQERRTAAVGGLAAAEFDDRCDPPPHQNRFAVPRSLLHHLWPRPARARRCRRGSSLSEAADDPPDACALPHRERRTTAPEREDSEGADRVMRFLDESGRSARVGTERPWLRVMATGTAARRSRMSEGAGDCSGLVRHAASGPQLIANERGVGSPVQLGRPPHKFPKPRFC